MQLALSAKNTIETNYIEINQFINMNIRLLEDKILAKTNAFKKLVEACCTI
jgi:hypothetical protein